MTEQREDQEELIQYIKEFINSELEYDETYDDYNLHKNHMDNLCMKYLINNCNIHTNKLINPRGYFLFHSELEKCLNAKKMYWTRDYYDEYLGHVKIKNKVSEDQNELIQYIKEFINSELEYNYTHKNNYIIDDSMRHLFIKYMMKYSNIQIDELIDSNGNLNFDAQLEQELKSVGIFCKQLYTDEINTYTPDVYAFTNVKLKNT